jgi:indolepyruvate ferredoxin oxidoreductase beta subunit
MTRGWSLPDMDGGIRLAEDRPIGIAILAMGGQGGGVLADWIVALAEAAGWIAQSTSVPGVAQRTGATVYYVEMIRPRPGRQPVLSLMPVPGDVDVVIAAELMEAGRAMQRGFVSAGTTFIASTHRAYAVTEKAQPGDGRANAGAVLMAARGIARRFLAADMQSAAERAGSVISAALFGALAASEALPFPRDAFEQTVRAAGVGVEASLRAFAAGFEAVTAPAAAAASAAPAEPQTPRGGSDAARAEAARALQRVEQEFPAEARTMLRHGLRRLIDYQDVAYAHEYLDRVARLAAFDDARHGFALTTEAARQIAVAMSYDDVIRVADLKTRAARLARVRAEVGARPEHVVGTTEFFHPRLEEICATLPARLGQAIERSAFASRLIGAAFARGRRLRTHTLAGYLPLYLLAGLKSHRRRLLRHEREQAHLNAWLDLVATHARTDYALAVEIVKCRRLVRGYSDTHARGVGKFGKVMGALPMLAGRPDAADWLRRLREAALKDEDGKTLDGALATVATLEAVPTKQEETV